MTKKFFNNIGKMAQAIYDGKDVRDESGTKLTYTKDETCPWRYGSISLTSGWKTWQKCYEVTDWKESVSEENPKLCYVSDTSEKDAIETQIVGLITEYSKKSALPFRKEYVGWKYAVPVPKEAVLKWLVDNEE